MSLYKHLLVWLVVIGLTACSVEPPPYTNLDNAALQEKIAAGVPVYDIRRAEEWLQTGVIKGSELLTFVDANGRMQNDFLPRFTSAVGKDDPVILICRTGNRTNVLARYLIKELGYSKVYNVKDGITRWIRERKPVVRP